MVWDRNAAIVRVTHFHLLLLPCCFCPVQYARDGAGPPKVESPIVPANDVVWEGMHCTRVCLQQWVNDFSASLSLFHRPRFHPPPVSL